MLPAVSTVSAIDPYTQLPIVPPVMFTVVETTTVPSDSLTETVCVWVFPASILRPS